MAKATGISKPVTPSATLASIVGSEPISRGEIMKRLWKHIKENNLQNSSDKRQINADAKLLPFFDGKKSVSMFDLAKFVKKHVS